MKDENIQAKALEETNSELADFLGEDKSNLPCVIDIEDAQIVEEQSNKMNATIPDKTTQESKATITKYVQEFILKLKNDPTDMTLSSEVYKLGTASANISIPNVSLYDTLIQSIMDDNQKGPSTEGSKEYNMLKLKRELDLINPAVLAKTPVKQKVLMFFNKSAIPGSEKIMDMIYERQETVKSSIDGVKLALLQNANDLDKQLADLMMVYKGLLGSHLVLKEEIYTGQLVYNEVVDILASTSDVIEKQNIEAILSDLTTQINSLLVEENMNAQFFAGSQLTAKLVREQQNQIRILVRQMEKAVLANLGLRVVAKGLENSVRQSKALGSAIANTIADTAKSNEQTSVELQKARTEGYIDLAKLQEGVDSLERTFQREAQANALIIKQGLAVSTNIRSATTRLESRINTNQSNIPFIDEKKD